MEIKKAVAALCGAAFSFVAWIPTHIHIATWCAVALIAVDLLTGMAVGWAARKFSSSVMRRKMISKLAQYLGLSAIFFVAAALSGQWALAYAAPLSVIAIEAVSICENLVALQVHGENLGPFAPLVQRLAKGFGTQVAAIMGERLGEDGTGNEPGEHRAG